MFQLISEGFIRRLIKRVWKQSNAHLHCPGHDNAMMSSRAAKVIVQISCGNYLKSSQVLPSIAAQLNQDSERSEKSSKLF